MYGAVTVSDEKMSQSFNPRDSAGLGRLGAPISRAIRVGLIAFGVAMGLLNIWLPGWGFAMLCGVGPVAIAVVFYRRLWDVGKFWLVIAGAAALQVPLAVTAKPYIDKLKFLFVFGFIVFGFFLIAWAVNSACYERREPDRK